MPLEIYQGNHKEFVFQIFDQNDSPVDLSSSEVKFVIKVDQSDSDYLISKSVTGGSITVDETTPSIINVNFVKEDTQKLTPKDYNIEIRALIPDGEIEREYTALMDKLTVKETLIND